MKGWRRVSAAVAAVLLCIVLCAGGFALGMAVYEVRNNTFQTGSIEIDLNGGEAVLAEEEFLFEPGMTVEKPFYIQNNGTWSVYYKLYFSQITGELADTLEVTILNGEETLLSGRLSQLTQQQVEAMDDMLAAGQRQELLLRIHFPKEGNNDYQTEGLSFALSALAVQTKNNPDKEFD